MHAYFSGAVTTANRLLMAAACMGCFSTAVFGQSIYTCIDARGRKITADRPIAECTDRVQRELGASGVVRREIGPSLTASELAAAEARDKRVAELRARDLENKRRDRALLQRYPSRDMHDLERAAALSQIDQVIQTAWRRSTELVEQQKAIDTELEFYVKDPSKAPLVLKRRIEEHDKNVGAHKRFVAEQEAEKKRVNVRFDEELVRLKSLWAMLADGNTAPGVATGAGQAPRTSPSR